MCDRCASPSKCRCPCTKTTKPTGMGSSAAKVGYLLCPGCAHYLTPAPPAVQRVGTHTGPYTARPGRADP